MSIDKAGISTRDTRHIRHEPRQSLGYALKRAQNALRNRMDQDLRPLGLNAPQYAVLSMIEADPGASNADLARQAFVTPQSMQGTLSRMEVGGLIERTEAADHGRIQRTTLTVFGKEVLAKAHRIVDRVEHDLREVVQDQEVPRLIEALLRIAEIQTRPRATSVAKQEEGSRTSE